MVSACEAEQRGGFYPAVCRGPGALSYSPAGSSVPPPLPSGSAWSLRKAFGLEASLWLSRSYSVVWFPERRPKSVLGAVHFSEVVTNIFSEILRF